MAAVSLPLGSALSPFCSVLDGLFGAVERVLQTPGVGDPPIGVTAASSPPMAAHPRMTAHITSASFQVGWGLAAAGASGGGGAVMARVEPLHGEMKGGTLPTHCPT
jgi:hypothetical protein